MKVYVSGISFRVAPIETREIFCFNDKNEILDTLKSLKNLDGVDECVLLSTCNRTEVYIYTEGDRVNFKDVEDLLCNVKGVHGVDFRRYFYAYAGQTAIKHIFKVASGMDSMLMGEDQILGQFKDAMNYSIEYATSSAVLNTLCHKAVTASKAIKTRSLKTGSSLSAANASVDLLKKEFGENIKKVSVLVIGSGKMGMLAIDELLKLNPIGITLACRRSDHLVLRGGVEIVDYHDRLEYLDGCDVVISATRSPHYTITKTQITENIFDFHKTRIFIDLAVPRDLDPEISQIDNIRYYNIDDFFDTHQTDHDARFKHMEYYDDIITENIDKFKKWYDFRKRMRV